MSGDLVQLAGEVTQYVTTAASAYGGAVLARTQDQAADATVGFGRRLAQRIFGVRAEGEDVPEALADVIADPDDGDNQAALRKAIRKALTADTELAEQVAAMLAEAPNGLQVGDGSNVVAGSRIDGDNIQIGSVGRDTHITRPGDRHG
ncbi:hypothetical protein [Actinomadura rayongensis]|uniref:Uncharacterized protein n=1 Tax=Actinomadura rayongensis TaxID=1429076 RepID=A0A6I4W003_9ACTN|nr:hypothetical protein [Actinomadura rayongensis]MXQ62538.1 hypothetical protein [Actinomadura rayongensis]